MKEQPVLLWLSAFGAVFFLSLGLWAFFDASSFFDELADFPPYNAHFIHDIGAFHAGLGAVLALALLFPRDGVLVALGGAGSGAVLHFIAHVRDHDLGGSDSDTIFLGILGVLMLAGAAWRFAAGRQETSGFR
jgi:formate/nitrite transporter FocA (FNT family)